MHALVVRSRHKATIDPLMSKCRRFHLLSIRKKVPLITPQPGYHRK